MADVTPEVVGEADKNLTSEGSKVQVIVLLDSPEMGFHGQSNLEITPSADLGEVPLTLEEVREGIPSEQITSQPNKATSSWSGYSRSLLPNQLLLNSYIPLQGQAPPMEEVFALRPEGA